MSRLTVLQALQTILETEFDSVYVYPDDLEDDFIEVPELPFIAIEELPAVDNVTRVQAADWIETAWYISMVGYVYKGAVAWNTEKDVAAKALAYPMRDTIRTLLEANMTIGGTILRIGDEQHSYVEFVTPIPWNGDPYYGCYFGIPVLGG